MTENKNYYKKDYSKGELIHNLVMEKIIRRKLMSNEVVHHIDFQKQNNKPENLYLNKTRSLHQKLHGQFGRLAKKITKELLKLGYIRFDKEIGEYYCIFDDGITNKFTKKWSDFEFIEKLAKEKEKLRKKSNLQDIPDRSNYDKTRNMEIMNL